MRPYRLALALATVAALGALTQPRSPAADPAPGTSLAVVPADASFYSASLHLGDQLDRFLKSNAYAKLKALPAAKYAADQLREAAGKPDNPLGQAMKLLQDPANKELADLLRDLPRQEIFVYGGANWARLIPVLLDARWAMQLAPFKAMIAGQDTEKAQGRAILGVLNAAADKLEVPELVFGFKLSKADPAVAQIKRLEGLLNQLAADKPQLKGRIKRTKVAGADALTVTLDGSLVPLDQIPWSDLEQQEGEYQKLRLRLKAMTLTVSLLVKDDYLLLTIGPHAGVAEQLGRGPALGTRPEFAPLAKAAGRKLVAVAYGSQALAAATATTGEDILGMIDTAREGLDKLQISDKRKEAIEKDLKRLVKQVTDALPKPGATLSFSFLTDRGQESYSYDHGTVPFRAAPRPLTILDHLGGSPILALAGAVNDPTPGYRELVGWIKIIYGHTEAVMKELSPDTWQQVEQGLAMALPFLKKFDEITGTLYLPALGAGEAALVFDAKWRSKAWVQGLDQGGKELPMLEVGIVRTVADSAKLVKAFQAYRDLANEVLAKAKEFGAQVPEGGVPKPEAKKSAAGTLYFWPLPPVGQDPQVQPNVGLSDKVMATSLSLAHGERLLTATPLAVAGGPLAEKRPATAAVVVDFAGLTAAARPWVEVALAAALAEVPDDAPPGLGKKDIPPQVRTVLDVLGCLRRYTSVTYMEGAVTVTHGELVIEDLK
ncbi:MAG TPA: hypothetical protein VGF55_05710 [Gemmataceae bacterium]|jgi:hypothetical protein